MQDCHIHLEKGDYTLTWIDRFVEKAQNRDIEEIWLLEHCYMFPEFTSMYDKPRAMSGYVDKWFKSKAGTRDYSAFLRLVDAVRNRSYPIMIKFGLEVCYFEEHTTLVRGLTKNYGFDFLVGSVHFIDGFAFDHTVELWEGVDVDFAFTRYFEITESLARCGLYDGIAHPDLLKLFGHKPSFSLVPQYDRLAKILGKADMYAEQNSGAHRRCPDTCELGMGAELLEAMRRYGVQIRTASDAHSPEDVGLLIKELSEK